MPAAKAACCDDFIVRLEKGYDTPAGVLASGSPAEKSSELLLRERS